MTHFLAFSSGITKNVFTENESTQNKITTIKKNERERERGEDRDFFRDKKKKENSLVNV